MHLWRAQYTCGALDAQVEGLSGVTVVAVACGAFHSLAVTSSGRLYEWGLIHTEPDAVADEVCMSSSSGKRMIHQWGDSRVDLAPKQCLCLAPKTLFYERH